MISVHFFRLFMPFVYSLCHLWWIGHNPVILFLLSSLKLSAYMMDTWWIFCTAIVLCGVLFFVLCNGQFQCNFDGSFASLECSVLSLKFLFLFLFWFYRNYALMHGFWHFRACNWQFAINKGACRFPNLFHFTSVGPSFCDLSLG